MTAGIIAEYNPFHRGHAWHIARTRAAGAGRVVVAMSGSTVQRGEFAVARTAARARMALENGADLVLLLPTPWSCARAQDFARAGVHLLYSLGCVDAISFGSECGEVSLVRRAARALDGEALISDMRRRIGEGCPFAQARQEALAQADPQAAALLRSPNDTLAVEYLRAMAFLGAEMEPIAVPRKGTGHDQLGGEDYPSASELRIILQDRGAADPKIAALPGAQILAEEIAQNRAPVDMQRLELAWLACLRSISSDGFARLPDISEGIEHLLLRAAREGTSLREVLAAATNRRYPTARVRRILFHALLGTSAGDFASLPRFIMVLGCTAAGRDILRQAKETAALPIVTRQADMKKLPAETRQQYALECRAADLMALAMPVPQPCCMEERRQPVVL